VKVNISIMEKRGRVRWRLARKDPETAEKVLDLRKDREGKRLEEIDLGQGMD